MIGRFRTVYEVSRRRDMGSHEREAAATPIRASRMQREETCLCIIRDIDESNPAFDENGKGRESTRSVVCCSRVPGR